MRESFIKKTANAFFKGRKARVLNELQNIGNEVIKQGMTVIIIEKNHVNKGYLDVQFNNIIIYGVPPENLQLVKETEYTWPIESDTLDLREHEFNIKSKKK